MVSCVPGSPMDCAAMTPTASPSSTMRRSPGCVRSTGDADAALRFAGQHRADLDALDTGSLNRAARSSVISWLTSTMTLPS
jgi:hypothetical protein